MKALRSIQTFLLLMLLAAFGWVFLHPSLASTSIAMTILLLWMALRLLGKMLGA